MFNFICLNKFLSFVEPFQILLKIFLMLFLCHKNYVFEITSTEGVYRQ